MLLKRRAQALKNLGQETKLFNDNVNEEVLIGQDYFDDNSEYDNREDLEDFIPILDPESPNDLDSEAYLNSSDKEEDEVELEIKNEPSISVKVEDPTVKFAIVNNKPMGVITPSKEQMEESMDVLSKNVKPKEDTSGNTYSKVQNFLEKYANGNDTIQILRKDLMSIISDVQWILESKNQHEQWALDFADALNELSVCI